MLDSQCVLTYVPPLKQSFKVYLLFFTFNLAIFSRSIMSHSATFCVTFGHILSHPATFYATFGHILFTFGHILSHSATFCVTFGGILSHSTTLYITFGHILCHSATKLPPFHVLALCMFSYCTSKVHRRTAHEGGTDIALIFL